MTDVMAVGHIEQLLPGPQPQTHDMLSYLARSRGQEVVDSTLIQRIRDLELVCRAQQKALNYLLLSLTAKHSRDLKENIWPEMEAADMVLDDA